MLQWKRYKEEERSKEKKEGRKEEKEDERNGGVKKGRERGVVNKKLSRMGEHGDTNEGVKT